MPADRDVYSVPVIQAVQLETVSNENLAAVLALQVREDQRDFLPSIASSIELAKGYPDAVCLAVRAAHGVCGFAMYGIDYESGSWKIFRLLVAQAFQGQGIGRRAMNLLLERLRTRHGAHDVRIVYSASNAVAHALYSSLGFVECGVRGDRKLAMLRFTGP